ncbi:MAG: hypothetical protein JWR21_3921 [Herminiimonas sp.]|nr:hypothetical protein [Herminiimonas sp.]MDB5853105.1 hypothetical protein [Herminiimonas sp.]
MPIGIATFSFFACVSWPWDLPATRLPKRFIDACQNRDPTLRHAGSAGKRNHRRPWREVWPSSARRCRTRKNRLKNLFAASHRESASP